MEEIAGPVDFEVAFGCAGFVAGSGVEGATPGDRPGDDLEILDEEKGAGVELGSERARRRRRDDNNDHYLPSSRMLSRRGAK